MIQTSPKTEKTRVFGWFEVFFDGLYLILATAIGLAALMRAQTPVHAWVGVMALVLAGGDAFHLIPRMRAAMGGAGVRLNRAIGLGKLVASVSMTVFYVILWHIGMAMLSAPSSLFWTYLLYFLAALRIALCLFPGNRWLDAAPPVRWAVYRNIPFLLMGVMVALLFGVYGQALPALRPMGLAIALSFAFYIPVVVGVHKNRKLGMLMIPKTCAYIWILVMCARI